MKKISIVIPAYGTEKYIDRCLNSVLKQTYSNLEIIVVNDCSSDKMSEILANYESIDSRVKVITHEKNRGLFQARLTGSEYATGDYICFLDSDDYVTDDYYRLLVDDIEKEDSDISISNIVIEETTKERYIYKLFESGRKTLSGSDILDEYFKQKGLNYSWHVVWNKLYKMDLWNKCKDYYSKIDQHLIMTEDFAYSTVLMSKAKKISYVNNAYHYYCSNSDASTSIVKIPIKKLEKNIGDIILTFNFVEDYLKNEGLFDKYKTEFLYWKNLYFNMWNERANKFNSNKEDEIKRKEILLKKVDEAVPNLSEYSFGNINKFYNIRIDFNDKLELLKKEIIDENVKVISFDIFDTLISRPFYEPSDLFFFLNKKFNEVFDSKGFLSFDKIRKESEWLCRNKLWETKKYDEVTLDEIYDFISEMYNLPMSKLKLIKKYEEELELKYCKRRNTGYELFSLAKFLGKKVICISDMYLSKDVVNKILSLNGYKPDNLYLSSELRKIKYNGTLFKYAVNDLKINYDEMLHIGDNYESDYSKPISLGIKAYHFPKALDVFTNKFSNILGMNSGTLYAQMNSSYVDNHNYLEYFGNRVSLALVANKFFDNPFVSYRDNSDFNCSPEMIGYYALGMHMFGVSKWLLDNTSGYDTLSFMARDGKLLLDVSNEVKKIYDKVPNFEYVYVSRKSLIPAILFEKVNFYKLIDYVKFDKSTPNDILSLLKNVVSLPNNYENIINDNGFSLTKTFKSRESFQKFINVLIDNFYDEKKSQNYINIIKKYFNNKFKGKVANFDVGYSGQPEFILSNLCEKPIDTFFIHCNNENGFINSMKGKFNLNTFYQYRPVFTGTLREYLISDQCPSCIAYEEVDGEVKPVFNKGTEQDYYDNEVLRVIQSSAVSFASDLVNTFDKDLNDFCFENYYMSVPFEYYLHLSKFADREIFIGLEFDENVGEKLNLIDFWDSVLEANGNFEMRTGNYAHDFYMNRVNGRGRLIRFIYYLFFDIHTLKKKIRNKFGEDSLLTKIFVKIYRGLRIIKHRGK